MRQLVLVRLQEQLETVSYFVGMELVDFAPVFSRRVAAGAPRLSVPITVLPFCLPMGDSAGVAVGAMLSALPVVVMAAR